MPVRKDPPRYGRRGRRGRGQERAREERRLVAPSERKGVLLRRRCSVGRKGRALRNRREGRSLRRIPAAAGLSEFGMRDEGGQLEGGGGDDELQEGCN